MPDHQMERLYQRGNLTNAMQRRFGACRGWPLWIRTAYTYLDQLRELIGLPNYMIIIRCATEGVHERQQRPDRVLRLDRDYLASAMRRRYGVEEDPDEAQSVAWHTLLALQNLLGTDHYEQVILAAAEGCDDPQRA